jgi:CMP-N,N'-diacetyllegionaminic acid synthase
MNNICFIPARGGSKGIKNKNLAVLDGLPLLYWSVLGALDAGIFSNIYVSSDDTSILEHVKIISSNPSACRVHGILRSAKNSGDKSTTESAILEFLQFESNIKNEDFLYILQPTSPFRHGDLIAEFSADFTSSNRDAGFTASSITPFLWKNEKPMYNINERKMRQDLHKDEFYYHEDGNLYACSVGHIRNKNVRLCDNSYVHINDDIKSLQIDTYLELDFMNFIAQKDKEIIEWKKDLVSLLQN